MPISRKNDEKLRWIQRELPRLAELSARSLPATTFAAMPYLDDPFSQISFAMLSGDGATLPEPQLPDMFSPLDLRDRVVIMLLFKQAISLETVEIAWHRWRQRQVRQDAGPLWRELLLAGAIDRAFLFQEVAEIYAFDRVTTSATDAEAVLHSFVGQFSDEQWRLVWKHKLIPVAYEAGDQRQGRRLLFATHDPTNNALSNVLTTLGIKGYNIGFAPEAWVEQRLQNSAPDFGWASGERLGDAAADALLVEPALYQKPTLKTVGLPDFAQDTLEDALGQSEGLILWTGPPHTGIEVVVEAMVHQTAQSHKRIMLLNRTLGQDIPYVQTVNLDTQRNDAFEYIVGLQPEVVYVGSIVHPHEARLAYALATTGHQVWARMYKADTMRALAHLRHLGVDPADLSASTHAAFGYRRVPKLCGTCKQVDIEPERRHLTQMGWSRQESETVIFYERGMDPTCRACSGQGYAGYTALVETLPVESGLREALRHRKYDEVTLWNQAMRGRLVPFQEASYELLQQGTCALVDVARALGYDAV